MENGIRGSVEVLSLDFTLQSAGLSVWPCSINYRVLFSTHYYACILAHMFDSIDWQLLTFNTGALLPNTTTQPSHRTQTSSPTITLGADLNPR